MTNIFKGEIISESLVASPSQVCQKEEEKKAKKRRRKTFSSMAKRRKNRLKKKKKKTFSRLLASWRINEQEPEKIP